MDQHHSKRPGLAVPAEPKLDWARPEVERLIAGGAEASSGSDVEGLDGLS